MARTRRWISVLSLGVPCLALTGCLTVNALTDTREALTESVIHGESGPKLLLVPIDGEITAADAAGGLGFAGQESTVALVREQLDRARAKEDIRGIILRINSPGGGVTAADVLYHEILTFKQETGLPVVAELMSVAASGGYYVAMAADEVIAHPTTVTGSIGVIFQAVNVSGLMDKVGVADQTITSGRHKDTGSPLRPMGAEERALLQQIVSDFHARFVEVVDTGRPGLDRERTAALADGRVYTAGQALEAGLVDSVGYLPAAVGALERRAGLESSRVVTYHRPHQWRENLYSAVVRGVSPQTALGLPRWLERPRGPGFYYLWAPGALP